MSPGRTRHPSTCRFALVGLLALLPAATADGAGDRAAHRALAPHERLIAILQTNDLHGGIEGRELPQGAVSGGLALFSGVARATRAGLARQFGERAGVLLVDGGDQFEGELLSRVNEGVLAFTAMSRVGYDAAVPGNHDYDLGPVGWLVDRADPDDPGQRPRGALERALGHAEFPVLAANVYLADSLVDGGGRPADPGDPRVDWSAARRLFPAYAVKRVAGVRVALIGLDHWDTPRMTHAENVGDLAFRDMEASYLEVRRELEGRADLFVLLMHYGDTPRNRPDRVAASTLVRRLASHRGAFQGDVVDAAVAGHTHRRNDLRVEGIPIVQSFSRGTHFGRIDLVFDTRAGRVLRERTRTWAGIRLESWRCDPAARALCSALRGSGSGPGRVRFEGVPVEPDPAVLALVAAERERAAPVLRRPLGRAERTLWSHRHRESPLANALTDGLRALTGADVALIHTRAIRRPIEAGPFDYEDLYGVIPYPARAITLGPVDPERLLALLLESARSCSGAGILAQSGLRVRFARDCASRPGERRDPGARLLRVETVTGELLFDRASGRRAAADRHFTLATLDALVDGRDAVRELEGLPRLRDLGPFREKLADSWAAGPVRLEGRRDRRWVAAEVD